MVVEKSTKIDGATTPCSIGADTRRLNQEKSLETKRFQDFFLLTLNELCAFRSTLRPIFRSKNNSFPVMPT